MVRIQGKGQSKTVFFDWKESLRCRGCPYIVESGFMNEMATVFCWKEGRKHNPNCPIYEGRGRRRK